MAKIRKQLKKVLPFKNSLAVIAEKISTIPDTRFVTWVEYLSLCSLGIYQNKTFGILYSWLFLTSVTISCIGSTVGFLNTKNPSDKLEASCSIIPQFICIVIFIELNLSSGKISNIFTKLKGKQQENIDNVRNRTDAFVKKKLIWCFVTLGVQGLGFTLPSLFSAFFANEISEKYSLVIPFWFSCADHNSTKILQSICWRAATKGELFCKNVVQVMISGSVIVVYSTTFALYGIMVGELVMHSERIKERVNDFVQEANVIDELYKMSKSCTSSRLIFYEEKLYHKFLQIIKYQRFLHSCIEETVDTWKRYVIYFYGSYLIDMTLFWFIFLTELENAKLQAMKSIMLAGVGSLIAFIIAYYAQIISHLNEDFINQMLEIPWYRRSIRFRKSYILVLALNRKKVPVRIAGIFELNLDSFSRMWRTIYSILNFMILKYG